MGNAEKRLADMAVLIKNVSTYQKTKPVYLSVGSRTYKEKTELNLRWMCSGTTTPSSLP